MPVTTITLHETSGQSMLSGYWTEVLLTRRSNGSFTLKVQGGGDGTRRRHEYCSKPFQTVSGFVKSLAESSWFTSDSSYGEGDIPSWLDSIAKLDPDFSKKLAAYCAIEEALYASSASSY